VLAVASGALALVARANLFPLMSGDADEPVYVYQARMLAEGHVTLAARVHAQFFYPWLFGQRGSRLFSQYQPGWPAVIAVAHLLGNERIALVIAAVAAVAATWFLGQQVAPGSGVLAAGLLLVSPIFVVQVGLYLSYLWTTALVTGALACVVAGVRSPRRAAFVGAGALIGLALLSRPFDALIVGAAAGAYVLLALRRDRAGLGRVTVWTVAGGIPFLLVTAAYNAHVTGNPVRFPLQAADPLDTFGFGSRSLARGQPTVHYTAHAALTALSQNARAMPHWFAGGGIGLLLALTAVALHRRRLEAWLLAAVAALFPLAYVFWWATKLAAPGAAKALGPHYYIPAFAPLAVLAGWALHDLTDRSRALAALALAAVLAGSLVMVPTILHNAHSTTALQRAQATALTNPKLENAVVVMRADPSAYMLLGDPFLVGDPELNGRILYAIDRGPASAALAQVFPRRALYQFVQRSEPGHSILKPSYLVERMEVVRGSTVSLRFDATNSGKLPVVVAAVEVNGRTVATQVLDRRSSAGTTASFEVVLATDPTRLTSPGRGVLVAAVAANAQVSVDVAFGPDPSRARADIFERRFFVARSGDGLAVQTPGLQYHRFDFGRVVWARENVGAHLAER
jgi:Dolichyl-phosphate-mannose-protein mannosyltransferase